MQAARRRERLIPYLLIAPSLVFLAAFFLIPLAEALLVSFRAGDGYGLGNYQRMAADINFAPALKNTLLLVAVVVPLQVALALGMAIMLQKVEKGRDLVLWVWTIPLGISDLAAGIVWLSLLTERGYLNSLLLWLGWISGPHGWLSYETPLTLFVAVVAAEVWRATAIVFIILVSGVQLIPKEYNEAAEVFGASAWTRFTKITPAAAQALSPDGADPAHHPRLRGLRRGAGARGANIRVLAGEAYAWQNDNQNHGVAAAYAVVILALSLAATIVFLKALGERKEPGQAAGGTSR